MSGNNTRPEEYLEFKTGPYLILNSSLTCPLRLFKHCPSITFNATRTVLRKTNAGKQTKNKDFPYVVLSHITVVNLIPKRHRNFLSFHDKRRVTNRLATLINPGEQDDGVSAGTNKRHCQKS